MSDFADMLVELNYKVPGAAPAVVLLELKNTLREFCGRTNAFVVPVSFATTPGLLSYSLVTRSGIPNRLMNVIDSVSGTPRAATFAMPGSVYLLHNYSTPQALVANIACNPDVVDDVENSVPDWFWTQFHTALVDGTLARMMAQVGKPYSNPRMATYHQSAFNAAMNGIRTEVLRRYSFRAQGWTFPTGGFVSRYRGAR